MSKRWLLATLAIGCLLLVAGCKPSVVGKWNVDTTVRNIPAKGTVEYKKDGSMVGELMLTTGGQQVPLSFTGTWKIEHKDGKTLLTDKTTSLTVGGQPLPSNMLPPEDTVEITFGKDSFSYPNRDGSGGKVTLTRAR